MKQGVLDHGYIQLVDTMGTDDSIASTARVSTGGGNKSNEENRKLIRYLLSHKHTSPFEFGEIIVKIKMPIFVARQWVRHRTASINEYSLRYSEACEEMYVPSDHAIQRQSQDNRQGRSGGFDDETAKALGQRISACNQYTQDVYKKLCDYGLTKELARGVLSINQYTIWYWKIDAHNLMHFLKLRMDNHAQWEIQQYAFFLEAIFKRWLPHTWEAWCDYNMYAVTLSMQAKQALKESIDSTGQQDIFGRNLRNYMKTYGCTQREIDNTIKELGL